MSSKEVAIGRGCAPQREEVIFYGLSQVATLLPVADLPLETTKTIKRGLFGRCESLDSVWECFYSSAN